MDFDFHWEYPIPAASDKLHLLQLNGCLTNTQYTSLACPLRSPENKYSLPLEWMSWNLTNIHLPSPSRSLQNAWMKTRLSYTDQRYIWPRQHLGKKYLIMKRCPARHSIMERKAHQSVNDTTVRKLERDPANSTLKSRPVDCHRIALR